MANEKKVESSVVEASVAEEMNAEASVEQKKEKEFIVEVKRERFGTSEDGVTPLYSYFIDISLLGGALKVSLAAKDTGNFALLNLIYGDKKSCNGRIKVSSFLPEKSKTPIETIEVEVYVLDDDGDEISTSLFPQRNSDKKCLENHLKKLKKTRYWFVTN